MILGRQHVPVPREDGAAASPKIFVTSYMRAHSMRNSNQVLHDDQTRCD